MLRPLITILIGLVLALLMALAAQFVLVPFVGTNGLGPLKTVSQVVFWIVFLGVTAYVVVTVVRQRRQGDDAGPADAAGDPAIGGEPGSD